MYQYRHILVRMRMGDSNRAIADSGVAGRNKVKAIKRIALEHGWLELDKDLPDDTQLAAIFGEKPPNPTTTSSVAPYADKVDKWYQDGVQGTTIHQALVDKYGFTGSYWSVIRSKCWLRKHQFLLLSLSLRPAMPHKWTSARAH